MTLADNARAARRRRRGRGRGDGNGQPRRDADVMRDMGYSAAKLDALVKPRATRDAQAGEAPTYKGNTTAPKHDRKRRGTTWTR